MFNIKIDKYQRGFNYKPRFYNEEKEALQRKVRLQKLSDSTSLSQEDKNQLHKDRAQNTLSGLKNTQERHLAAKSNANAKLIRLILIFAFFAGLYWWANSNLTSFVAYLMDGEERPSREQPLDDFGDLPYRTIPADKLPK